MKTMDRNYAIALGGGDFLQIVDGLKVVRTELDVRTGKVTLVRTGTYASSTTPLGPKALEQVDRIRAELAEAHYAKFANRGGFLFVEDDAEMASVALEVAPNGAVVVRLVSGGPAPLVEVNNRLGALIILLGALDLDREVRRITRCDRFLCQAVDELFTTIDEETDDAESA